MRKVPGMIQAPRVERLVVAEQGVTNPRPVDNAYRMPGEPNP